MLRSSVADVCRQLLRCCELTQQPQQSIFLCPPGEDRGDGARGQLDEVGTRQVKVICSQQILV